jgi:nitroreductase
MTRDKVLELPRPADPGGKTVFDSLAARHTTRDLSETPLSRQELANVLWAAKGVNRAHAAFGVPGLTAASASNSQEVEVYAALREGCYRYAPHDGVLHLVAGGDFRTLGEQLDVPLAPLHLFFVADVDKLLYTRGYQEPRLQDPEFQNAYYFVDTGLIAQNVYLYAASVGLGAWFHNCSPGLADTLKLRDTQRVLFAQSVGHPA